MSRQEKKKLKELEESVSLLQQAAVLLLEKHNARKRTKRK
jgi:hypothetical protein